MRFRSRARAVRDIVVVSSSPELAAKGADEAAFTVLAPAETFELSHDPAGVYNFTSSGTGNY